MPANNVRCQIILPTTVAMSAAEKARNDSVRTLPSAPRLKLSDMAEASSGASTIVTMSYRPCVQKMSFTVTPWVKRFTLTLRRLLPEYVSGYKPAGDTCEMCQDQTLQRSGRPQNNVPSGSSGVRGRLGSFNFCMGALHRFTPAPTIAMSCRGPRHFNMRCASGPKYPTLRRDVHWSARLTDGLPG